MELSDPATPLEDLGANDSINRRKSGRAKQQPVLLQQDPNANIGSVKRKRAESRDDVDDNNHEDISKNEESLEESDGEADEEELKEKRKKSRAKKGLNKPVAKKARLSNTSITKLAVRPATNGVKKASKPRKARARLTAATEEDGTGLYGTHSPCQSVSLY